MDRKMDIQFLLKESFLFVCRNPIIFFGAIIVSLFTFTYHVQQYKEIMPIVFFLQVLVGVLIYSMLSFFIYNRRNGNENQWSEIFIIVLRKYIFLVIITVLYMLACSVGFVLLIIPGIFLLIKFYFCTYPLLFEDNDIRNSFKKSWEITKGNWSL